MKKILIIGGLIILFLFIALPANAQDDYYYDVGWEIKSFDVKINLEENTDFQIEEKILTDFDIDKHGIFRYIPLKYKKWGIFNSYLKINLEGIYKADSTEWDYEQTKSGKFWEYKIGSPNYYITGEQLYKIVYEVKRGIRFFDDHDELYWNVTGIDWEAPIKKASAIVVLPKDIGEQDLKFVCYTGYFGSTEQNCNYSYDKKNRTVTFNSVEKDPYENYLTIAIWFPKGYLTEFSAWTKFIHFITGNYFLFLPIIVLVFMLLLWNAKGRDPKPKKPIVAQYDACDHLTPSLLRVIEKEGIFNPHDLPAELVHLATMRILKIKEIDAEKKKYKIIKRRDWKDNKKLTSYQKYLLDQIFTKDGKPQTEVDLDDLKSRFDFKAAQQYKKLANAHIKEKGYYKTPVSTKGVYIGLGVLVMMASIFWATGSGSFSNFLSGSLSALIVIIVGFFMPKKSKAGMDMLWYILGLKEYIRVAEADRIKHEEADNIFSKILPFAMSLGMTEKWVNVFQGIIKEPPEWLEVKDPSAFTTAVLASTLTQFKSTTYKSFAPAYRHGGSSSSSGFSSGGGFSGGGGGGGGGGSW